MVEASRAPGPAGAACRRGYNWRVANADSARRARVPPWRSPVGRAVLLAIGLAGAGIAAAFLGGGRVGDPEPAPPAVTAATQQVATTLKQFQRALAQGDFATICGNLFSLEAREAAGGDRCPSVLADTAGGLHDPEVQIISITHRGKTATAVVRARVGNGPPVTDTVRLVRQGGRYKIVSAGKETGDK
jgi:FlaG/FlaF family flagellin (archaellin)